MKVLSLLQPWASLVACGAKRYEVRGWQTPHRGPLLIHASARVLTRREKILFGNADYFRDFIDVDNLPYGSVIAQVELTAIFRTDLLVAQMDLDRSVNWQQELAFDNYGPKRYAWKLEGARPLRYFLPMKGSLGLWNYDGEI